MKYRTADCNRILKSTFSKKPSRKSVAVSFCCVLLFVLFAGTNAVTAARYRLRERGNNIGDCFCCVPAPEPAESQWEPPPPSLPAGCFQRLGAIGLMCRLEDQPWPTLDIWGITSESKGVFLLRVSQSQVEAIWPAGRVAQTADDHVTVCVREDRDVEVSMGPGPEGKIHHVTLQGGLHGPVLGTRDSYAPRSDIQDPVPPDTIVHVVQYGETLFAIANTYGVPLQDIIKRNRLTDGDLIRPGQELIIRDAAGPSARQLPTVTPQAPRADGSIVHVVRYGETLFAIANTYGVTMQDVIERNRLADGALIRPGQELIIRDAAGPSARQLPMVTPQAPRPDGSIVHVVRYGETLFAIANTYGVTVTMQDIIERNRLTDGDVIRPGQELIIRDAP